ncbi:MAG TPA: LLM class flavin-dependent oxidoreductase [Acidimicrobiales bacterium]|nr:LLM class flavin-dependent oxidoreductase [Acidimicrobiales bacterium]
MSEASLSIRSLSFLVAGSFTDENPHEGLGGALTLFEYGERLGFDGGWVRQQHLVPNVSSAPVFLAAASQRTRQMELGTGVIPMGYESPFRLAEDLSTLDVLAQGRLQVGLSAGVPMNAELLASLVYDGDWHSYDLSHARISRLAQYLQGEFLGDPDTVVLHPTGPQRPRLRPHDPDLARRLWYGAGSLSSVTWAAEHGLHLAVGNICAGAGLPTDDFATAQLSQIRAYRAQFTGPGEPRIAVGRVIVPFDSADGATRAKYREYQASRHQRTLAPQGERRVLIARDVVGTSDEILETLHADPVLADVSELQLELPYAFSHSEYEQILYDVVSSIAPELGWSPLLVAG